MSANPPTCPRCGVPVQPDWDWCHGCNFRPEDLGAGAVVPGPPAPSRPTAPLPPLAVPAPTTPSGPRAGGRHRVGPVVSAIVVIVVAVIAVAAVAVVVTRGSASKASEPTATPAFAAGLAVWFTSTDPGSHPAILPDGLAGCVQGKLDIGDATTVSALQRPVDDDRVQDATTIHVFRALRDCDVAGAAEVLTGQGNIFSKLGVAAIAQQQCVMEHLIGAAGTMDDRVVGHFQSRFDAKLADSFQACVPIAVGLTAVLSQVPGGPTADQAACIAQSMGDELTWSDLLHTTDPAVKQKLDAALNAAIPLCR